MSAFNLSELREVYKPRYTFQHKPVSIEALEEVLDCMECGRAEEAKKLLATIIREMKR